MRYSEAQVNKLSIMATSMAEFFRIFFTVFWGELSLAGKRGTGLFFCVCFFVMAAVLFPLALGPYPDLLQRAGVGALWICALFASLLTQEAVWAADFDDGTFDVLALSPLPLPGAMLGKMLAHWILSGVPLALLAPVLGFFFALPPDIFTTLCVSLLAGTFVMSFAGGVVAILALGARRSGVLLPLMLLPLYIPVLIFGTSLMVYFLLSLAVASLPLCPLAGSACLRRALG